MKYFVSKNDKGEIVAKVQSDADIEGMEEVDFDVYSETNFAYLTALPAIYTGLDAIDAMSKEHANNPAVDVRDIARIAVVPDVRMVKSKLKRVADACGISVADLVPGIPVT